MARAPPHNNISINPPVMSGYLMQSNTASPKRPKDEEFERSRAFVQSSVNEFFKNYNEIPTPYVLSARDRAEFTRCIEKLHNLSGSLEKILPEFAAIFDNRNNVKRLAVIMLLGKNQRELLQDGAVKFHVSLEQARSMIDVILRALEAHSKAMRMYNTNEIAMIVQFGPLIRRVAGIFPYDFLDNI